MNLADQRAQLEQRRDALVALWIEKKINLPEFSSGIEILSASIHMLDHAINLVYENCMLAPAANSQKIPAR